MCCASERRRGRAFGAGAKGRRSASGSQAAQRRGRSGAARLPVRLPDRLPVLPDAPRAVRERELPVQLHGLLPRLVHHVPQLQDDDVVGVRLGLPRDLRGADLGAAPARGTQDGGLRGEHAQAGRRALGERRRGSRGSLMNENGSAAETTQGLEKVGGPGAGRRAAADAVCRRAPRGVLLEEASPSQALDEACLPSTDIPADDNLRTEKTSIHSTAFSPGGPKR